MHPTGVQKAQRHSPFWQLQETPQLLAAASACSSALLSGAGAAIAATKKRATAIKADFMVAVVCLFLRLGYRLVCFGQDDGEVDFERVFRVFYIFSRRAKRYPGIR